MFVAGLSIVGFLLLTYMGGQPRTRDFWYSAIGGVAVPGVVFFPTWRSGLPKGAPRCGDPSFPPGCSAIEQWKGESWTAHVHAGFAITFVASLALMSFLFARAEVRKNNRRMQRFHLVCGGLILLAGAWALIGGAMRYNLGHFTPLYTGEVVAVWAFGTSWLFTGFHIRRILAMATGGAAANRVDAVKPDVG